MSGVKENFVIPFTGALQASLAVLLTIFYGVIAAQFDLLNEKSAKDISKACVRLFLPALLIVNVGQQLSLESGTKYLAVFIWAIIYNVLSMVFGLAVVPRSFTGSLSPIVLNDPFLTLADTFYCRTKFLNLPQWVTPAIAFNNTTSLPLLLVQSLQSTGILDSLDASSDTIDRAKSYFLVNAMVSNSLTFALGPRLLNGQNEDSPEEEPEKEDEDEDDAERGTKAIYKTQKRLSNYYSSLSPRTQAVLDFLYQFWNPPLIGAVIGGIVGLVPALHTLFFSKPQEGGYLNAWLTASIKNIGDLFASLQVVVVGVKLSQAMLRYKKGEQSGSVPWKPFTIITVVRFVIWPLISIPLVWVLASKTNVLSDDPILWFAMMLMPTGPPAMKLTALADVSGAGDEEKMSIAKFLTISYAISPLICFSVVGALKASQAIPSS
ncbi:membrane transporter [Aureobasidium sp. EXF-12298]|nr:membrane transporter [Aureobasidium sp. EXF-12298]